MESEKRNRFKIIRTNSGFVIKKHFLFFWISVRIPFAYTLGKFHGGCSDWMIRRMIPVFGNFIKAEDCLNKYFINKRKIKGVLMVKHDSTWADFFLDISHVTEYYANRPCYQSIKPPKL